MIRPKKIMKKAATRVQKQHPARKPVNSIMLTLHRTRKEEAEPYQKPEVQWLAI
jgi:hypothetical protein